MFGLSVAWVPCRRMRRILPTGTLTLFRGKRRYSRGEIVLVHHPEHGRIVRRVFAAGRRGRYSLEVLGPDQVRGLGMIEPEWVRGAMLFRLL